MDLNAVKTKKRLNTKQSEETLSSVAKTKAFFIEADTSVTNRKPACFGTN